MPCSVSGKQGENSERSRSSITEGLIGEHPDFGASRRSEHLRPGAGKDTAGEAVYTAAGV